MEVFAFAQPQIAASDCCCNTMLLPKMAGILISAFNENRTEDRNKMIPRHASFVIVLSFVCSVITVESSTI